jgi:hypothetical protein
MGRKPANKDDNETEDKKIVDKVIPKTHKSLIADFLKKTKTKGMEMASVLSTSLF